MGELCMRGRAGPEEDEGGKDSMWDASATLAGRSRYESVSLLLFFFA